jgi:hypothetical protein
MTQRDDDDDGGGEGKRASGRVARCETEAHHFTRTLFRSRTST